MHAGNCSSLPAPPGLSESGVLGAGRGGGALPWSQRLTNRLTANSLRSEGEGALTRVGTMGAVSEQVLPAVQDGEILTRIACLPASIVSPPCVPLPAPNVCGLCKAETLGSLVGPGNAPGFLPQLLLCLVNMWPFFQRCARFWFPELVNSSFILHSFKDPVHSYQGSLSLEDGFRSTYWLAHEVTLCKNVKQK